MKRRLNIRNGARHHIQSKKWLSKRTVEGHFYTVEQLKS
jgi:hypothetical protein